MSHSGSNGRSFHFGCPCCAPCGGVSRRQFLCTTAIGAVAAPAIAASVIAPAKAQQAPSGAAAPGRQTAKGEGPMSVYTVELPAPDAPNRIQPGIVPFQPN